MIFYFKYLDGIHTNENAIKFAYSTNPKGLMLVTDCIAAVDKPDGEYLLGEQQVVVKDRRAFQKGTNVVAGR